ncbi:Laminin subunit alpha-2 [Acipenser ruthenus]|uniref:Basement membrane-specific heparan sulfate proteoglycan core protein n=1 Tax=Acipenser ruthenus TaxID=7906 RepID=A0A444UME2_ACIRT|nr:Laminin subunit alpha-2 [Acipenser ruthenus]
MELLGQICKAFIPVGLFPAVLNLASMAEISTNATCGENGPEMYCKLVEHVPGQPVRNPQCRTCNLASNIPYERHPITYAIDGTNRWWQSPSIQNGMDFHYVTITLDLGQVFQIAYVIIKAANSPRPGNWILERSMDGDTFEPWQYFAITDTECLTRFNILPRTGPPSYTKDDDVICTSYYSKIHPLENGEIHTSLINGRPSADDPSPVLLNFTSARYIRFQFRRIRTLNADLMTLAYNDPRDVDPIVTRRKFSCECEHNTCGENCDRCCPGYNQKPWMAGTFLTRHVCEKCNCHGKSEECIYNDTVANNKQSLNVNGEYKGGGVCLKCIRNTAGINCETCTDGYFRPSGVTSYEPDPCVPCSCDPDGSLHDTCIKDETKVEGDLGPGSCHCKLGYGGKKCDRCAFGYTGFPHCIRCNCSLDGSQNTDPCEKPCNCKENVEGENCDRCKVGFYNLQNGNPKGCEKCYCSGVSSECTESHWTYSNVSDMSRWFLTGPLGIKKAHPVQDSYDGPQQLSISNEEARKVLPPLYYWSAQPAYLGNKLAAYGGKLIYTVSYDIVGVDKAVQATTHTDVIIEGNGMRIMKTQHGIQLYPFKERTEVIVLRPEHFKHQRTGLPVSKKDFMMVLTNVTHLLIRASYSNENEAICRLSSVSLEVAVPYSDNTAVATAVEICNCPPGYTGTSCEACLTGFRRANSTLYRGLCEPCQCFGHSDYCDDFTGECLGCKHDTTGPFCDLCIAGFYGDATKGTPSDCQPCACPLQIPSNNRQLLRLQNNCSTEAVNLVRKALADKAYRQPLRARDKQLSIPDFAGEQGTMELIYFTLFLFLAPIFAQNQRRSFSPTCYLDTTGELICDRCPPGYTGSRCDRCSEGYHGHPTEPGGSCQPCQCNGNLDLSTPRSCDPVTGACLKCREGFGGQYCESCSDGYFGDAIVAKNCQPCQCNNNGSMSEVCNPQTGQCECRQHVVGKQCDECMSGTFDLKPSRGCVPCNCNSFGSKSFDCDESGQCRCQPGVTGLKCDRCAIGYYSFQEGGCTPCHCSHVGNNCDASTGQCICPPHTIGEKCDRCAPNYWGHDIVSGCKPCGCNVVGSLTLQCNSDTGCCFCRPGYTGEKCTECKEGYRDFPHCIACECSLAGTASHTCDTEMETCSCTDRTGQCTCKANVEGLRCDRCKTGTFGLSTLNPLGCSNCYCFGMTTKCTEAKGLIRMWLSLKPDQMVLPLVDKMNQRRTTNGVSFQHPEIVANVDLVSRDLLSEPFYWKLPEQFQGSMITAYGGKLKYAIYFEARDETGRSTYEPQVIIRGGANKDKVIVRHMPALQIGQLTRHEIDMIEITAYGGKLKYAIYFEARDETGRSTYEPQVIIRGGANKDKVIVRHMPALQIGQLTRHEIDMIENNWKFHGSNDVRTMTREDFMDILFNIEYILIKASYGNSMRQSRISEISMEVAEEGQSTFESERAYQIEKCECPPGYSGLSCEECAAGYYRLSSRVSGRASSSGIGSCVQCQCNGHSEMCDPETSICQNCRHNTVGDRCEQCASGFYGVVRGSTDDCRPCACPFPIPSNNFNPTCVMEGFHDFRCTNCPLGYEGQYCERCSPGFYGDPRSPGGSCEECKCDPNGSLPLPCDQLTGQCQCKQGTTGLACDRCMERHVCEPQQIIFCDDECTGLLLNDLDSLGRMVMSVNLTGPLPPPYKVLYRFENMTQELKHLLSPQRAPERLLQLADSNLGTLVTEMDELLSRATKVSADGEQTNADAERTRKRAEDLDKFVKNSLQAAEALKEKARKLNETLGSRDGVLEKSLQEMHTDIEKMLAELRRRKLGKHQQIADEELGAADALLTKVKKLFGDPHQATEDLKLEVTDKLADYKTKLDDAQALLEEAKGKIREADHLSADNQRNMTALEKKKQAVNGGKKDTEGILAEGESILGEASRLLDDINQEIEDLEEIGRNIGPLRAQLKYKVEELTEGLTENNLPELVLQAENHAAQLNDSSSILDGILAEAKNLSFNATAAFKAYSNIKDSIEEAEKIAKQAKASATEAVQLASSPKGSLKDDAKTSLQKSFRLWNEAKKLDNVVKDTSSKLQAAKDKARHANETASDVLGRIKDINMNLMGLQKNYSKLEDDVARANAIIQDPVKNINAASAKVKDLEDEADRLLEKLKPIKELQDNLKNNISQIKELISQARKQANSIKVSVSSGGDCIRTYRPEIKKGRYNAIVLNVKTAMPDNLLFYLGSAKYSDFLAIEMRKGTVNFLWDVGSGVGRVEYPDITISDQNWYRIEASRVRVKSYPLAKKCWLSSITVGTNLSKYTSDFLAIEMRKGKVNFLWDVGSGVGRVEYPDITISDQNWYRIEASRNGRNGTISVHALEGPKAGIMPSTFSGVSPEGYTILDVDADAYLFVGGLTSKIKKADAVKTTTFSGCMGETYLDSKPIGLWNYRERQGNCKGCVVSPQPPDTEGTMQFDGEGYAAVSRPTRWNPNVSTVMFKFRTFSTNALLMYFATKDMVVVTKMWCSNEFFSLTANVAIVDIETNKEEKIETVSGGTSSGLNLKDNERIYFGGLPTLRNFRAEVTLKKFAGCLKDIEVSRTPYNLLSSTDYTGLTKGCSIENIHTVSFPKPGFVELNPFSLDVGTEISFSFSTQNDTGIILFGSGGAPTPPRRKRRQTGQPYAAVFLHKGRLEVVIFIGTRDPRRVMMKPEEGILHDGREHSIRIERTRGKFTVQVDEENRLEQRLPNDQSINIKKLFVGGIPTYIQASMLRSINPFEGCIWNLVINTLPIDFAQTLSFENAEIGQCPTLAPPPKPLPEEEIDEVTEAPEQSQPKPAVTTKPIVRQPATPAPVTCTAETEPVTLLNAKQFGLSRNSHVAMAFDDTKVKSRLIIEFEIRTEAESGLVFYMARINHADFATIQMKDGIAHLSFDLGSGNTSTSVPQKINDGQWHKVKVSRDKQRGILTVDGRYFNQTTSPKKADILDVVGMVYIGGVPVNYTIRRIGPVVYSINACIRNFKMLNSALDLDNPTSSYNIGTCFVNAQTGTYFNGTGYAKTVGAYKVGTDLSIELEFRTSQRSGVLLGISGQKMDGLGIELVNGKMLFHADNGVGRFTATYEPDSQGGLCDGQWHRVVATKLKHRLELTVDDKKVEGQSPNTHSASADTNDPVFVGGYPDGLKQFGLTINTPFKGCIRNLKLTKGPKPQEINFSKALELQGVQPMTCPAN